MKISELLWMFIHLLLSADRMYLLSILSRPIYTLFIFIATRHSHIIQGQYMYVICISLSWLRWSRVAPVIYTIAIFVVPRVWIHLHRNIMKSMGFMVIAELKVYNTHDKKNNQKWIWYILFFFWTFSDLVDTCILAKIGLFYSSLLYLMQSIKMLFLSVHV